MDIFEQLTLPLKDGHTTTLDHGPSGSANLTEAFAGNDPTSEINVIINLNYVHYSNYKIFLETFFENKYRKSAGTACRR